jgi:hypothetical protein
MNQADASRIVIALVAENLRLAEWMPPLDHDPIALEEAKRQLTVQIELLNSVMNLPSQDELAILASLIEFAASAIRGWAGEVALDETGLLQKIALAVEGYEPEGDGP